jgi:hypothetical protein
VKKPTQWSKDSLLTNGVKERKKEGRKEGRKERKKGKERKERGP